MQIPIAKISLINIKNQFMLRDKKKQIAAEHRGIIEINMGEGRIILPDETGKKILCIHYSSKVEE